MVPNGRESSPFSEAVVVAIGIRVRGPQLRHARRCDAIRGAEHDPAPIWGYADLHNHQLSNKGFGGVFMWGESFTNVPDPSTASALAPDIAWSLRDFRAQAAMPWCDFSSLSPIGSVHGPGHSFDLIGTIALGQGYKAVGGYPGFDGWPRWSSKDHEDGNCLCGGLNPNGLNSAFSCIQAAACGGIDQRDCCSTDAADRPCASGLITAPGSSGDCLCGGADNLAELTSSNHCVSGAAIACASPTPIPG